MRQEPNESLAGELQRRGLRAPTRLLLDAHRPLRPLLAHGATFLSPLLTPLLGRRIDALRTILEEPAAYDALVDRLGREP